MAYTDFVGRDLHWICIELRFPCSGPHLRMRALSPFPITTHNVLCVRRDAAA